MNFETPSIVDTATMEHHSEHEGRPLDVGKNRIEALSDGIFAVAMTLLVFDFHVPSLPHDAPNVQVLPALLHLWPKFVSYAVSFVSLGVFWVGHHNMYHAVRRADRSLLWLNILFFMFVAFLPFSTSVLNAFPETEVAPLMFGANLTIIGWLLFFQWRYADWQKGMLADFVSPEFRKTVQTRFLLYPVIATLTMMICFWSIPISLAVYMALLPLYMIPGSGQVKAGHAAETPKVEEVADGETHRRLRLTPKSAAIAGAAVLLIVGWAAFRPELLLVNMRAHDKFPAQSMTMARPVVVANGAFHGVAHVTHGSATVYQFPDGSRILRLMNFSTSNGPDVHVFLITARDAGDNATFTASAPLEIAKMKGNVGDQNYDLPANVDLTKYHAVTLWCMRFHVNFATAPLTVVGPAGRA